MDYLGEWMWAALLGRTMVAVAFASALLATVAFVRGNVKLGRTAFFTHAASTLGVIALMFVLFFGHRYEFQYIWKHLNNAMPMRFVLSAFWGGQKADFSSGCSGTTCSHCSFSGGPTTGNEKSWRCSAESKLSSA